MKAVNEKIVVRVNQLQKDNIEVAGVNFLLAKQYNNNRREKNPVVCEVVQGNKRLKAGTFLLVHHNRFAEYSPYELGDGLYAIPYDRSLFARIDEQGEVHSLCGNIICKRVEKTSSIGISPSNRKNYNDRVVVLNKGYRYKKGDEIFCYPFSDYEIVFVWKGEEKRVIKVYFEDICGILSKK